MVTIEINKWITNNLAFMIFKKNIHTHKDVAKSCLPANTIIINSTAAAADKAKGLVARFAQAANPFGRLTSLLTC